MKKNLLFGLLISSLAVPAVAQVSAVPDAEATKYNGYKLSFAEEFESGEVPDHDIWNFEYGYKRNNEDQLYRDHPSNAFIRDGKLVIRALADTTLNPFYDRYSKDKNKSKKYTHTSASMQSVARFHYGIWETCAKIPVGSGYWPAIWGTGNTRGWPNAGELDIMEYYGNAIHANLAWGNSWQDVSWASKAPKMSEFAANFGDVYHIWRCEWDHNSVRIYLDDRLLNETDLDRTVNSEEGYNPYRDPNNGFQVWLNLALGGNNGGDYKNAVYPAEYLVEYTRVYEPTSIVSPIIYRIQKAQALYDRTEEGEGSGQFPSSARRALEDAIAAAQAIVDANVPTRAADDANTETIDDETVDAALDALQAAMDSYEQQMNTGIKEGEAVTLSHNASGYLLTSGWLDDKKCVLLLPANIDGYNNIFTFVKAPGKEVSEGYNMKTPDGEYVYRNSWNLFIAENPTEAQLNSNDYLFRPEVADGHIVIKNRGTEKYFGTDANTMWAHFYSDKAGAGNRNAYFNLAPLGIDNAMMDGEEVTGVYNLTGVRVADNLNETGDLRGLYIVVKGTKAYKVVF